MVVSATTTPTATATAPPAATTTPTATETAPPAATATATAPPTTTPAQQEPSCKSDSPEPIVRNAPENRHLFSQSRLAGSIVGFEPVRGRGDLEVMRLAECQHGHLHLAQLRAAGIKHTARAHRVRTGQLHRVLPSVYLVGRPQRMVAGRVMAAALYFRGDALVTGRAAAQLWGMLDTTQQLEQDDPIDVLLVGRRATPPAGIRVRRAGSVTRQDIRWRDGIPVTSPALTALQLAAELDDFELEAALVAGMRTNQLRVSRIRDVIERNAHAKGVGALRVLIERSESLHDTRSVYERRLLKLLQAAELPLPVTNVWVAGKLVDALWPDLSSS